METKKTYQFTTLLIIVLLSSGLSSISLFAQDANKTKPNKPDIKYKVNKEYDNKGNITRYDSTYSYSWSSDGQIPLDIDSIISHFKNRGFINFDFDSAYNHFGINMHIGNDSIISRSFPNFDKQFEDLFKNSPFSIDPFFDNNSNSFFGGDFQKQLMEQQKRIEQLFHDFYFNPDSIYLNPNSKLKIKPAPQGKAKPEIQNYFPNKKTDKTISV